MGRRIRLSEKIKQQGDCMSDTDYFQLREMIRKLQQKVVRLEKQLEEQGETDQSHTLKSEQQQELALNGTHN